MIEEEKNDHLAFWLCPPKRQMDSAPLTHPDAKNRKRERRTRIRRAHIHWDLKIDIEQIGQDNPHIASD